VKSNFLNLPFRSHYLEISRLIPAVFTVTILLSGILTISFVNLPKVSAQTTTANQSSKTGPRPNPLEPSPQLSAAQKSASTNKTCSLTSTSVKLNGTDETELSLEQLRTFMPPD
jgi:hypothetical protein